MLEWEAQTPPSEAPLLWLNFGFSWETTVLKDFPLATARIRRHLLNQSPIDEHVGCCQFSIVINKLCYKQTL